MRSTLSELLGLERASVPPDVVVVRGNAAT